jgi:transcriptional regulator with XRE-family HTH domain
MSSPPNRLRVLRLAKGWSLRQLAEAAATSKSQIDKLEKGHRRLTVDWMIRLAQPLACDPRALLPFGDAPEDLSPLPLLGVRREAANAQWRLRKAPVGHLSRPSFLTTAHEAYALVTPDATMAPMYRKGQTLFVDPRQKPRVGGGVIVLGHDRSLLVARYHGETLRQIAVETLGNVPARLSVARADVVGLHRIVASIEPD